MPEAFVPLTDFVNESKSIPRDHPLDKPVAKWIEEEVLDGEVVEAGVVILRTRGCYWSIKEGCSMCGYFNDTVLMANEMNINYHLDSRLQFDFLINIIRKRKRFSKWLKPQLENDVEVVKEYYGYSNEKARQVLPLLSSEQINGLKKKVSQGGKSRK